MIKLVSSTVEPRTAPRKPPWPQLDPAALYGLAGRFVRALAPHTEADPVAVLVQFLVAYGSCIGRGPHFRAEADLHHTNLYAVLVGETSKARKGSSWGRVRDLFKEIDEEWATKRVQEGLSSGEGLIWQVRDEITKVNAKGEEVVVDEGVDDKRLLLVESEYAGVFKVMAREGSTLSPIIRRAWDRGDLEALTKNSPARATNAHISIIGHITTHELRRYLTETEAASGFANRHLFCCVRRSKCLPDGGQWTGEDAAEFTNALRNAVDWARLIGHHELKRDEQAREIWHAVYPELSEGRPGMVGAMIARGEAQVMRLAEQYALLDCSSEVGSEHLLAALALWEYCEASVKYVFGSSTGDPIADTIIASLEERGQLSRTEIRDLFGRHAAKHEVDRALRALRDSEMAEAQKVKTKGRSAEVWRLKDAQ
jgi:hypothetical protein